MISTLVTVSAGIIAFPAFFFALECLIGLFRIKPVSGGVAGEPPAFAVLVPAHDEADGIGETVSCIRAQLRGQDRLLVIADNCSDDTASLGRAAGAEVIERSDLQRRGKGYALAAGRDALRANPPQVVIVMDADCWANPDSLAKLAAEVQARNAPVQATNLLSPSDRMSPLVQLSNFAFLLKNLVRQRALRRLGAPGLLQGTGMGFPWEAFLDAPLASDAIAEDLEIGLHLIAQGYSVAWTEQASVWSKPASRDATLSQRTRWEHGFLSTAVNNAPRLVKKAIELRRPGLMILALDLLIPPVAMLVAGLVFALGATLMFAAVGGTAVPFMILAIALVTLVAATACAWAAEGRRILPFASLLRAPVYVAWKLPIYARLVGNRQKEWVRTARQSEVEEHPNRLGDDPG